MTNVAVTSGTRRERTAHTRARGRRSDRRRQAPAEAASPHPRRVPGDSAVGAGTAGQERPASVASTRSRGQLPRCWRRSGGLAGESRRPSLGPAGAVHVCSPGISRENRLLTRPAVYASSQCFFTQLRSNANTDSRFSFLAPNVMRDIPFRTPVCHLPVI